MKGRCLERAKIKQLGSRHAGSTPSTAAALPDPQRGEVWQVNFDPSRGDEIRKHRPALVVSVATAGKLALRVIVPLTGWHPAFAHFLAHANRADARQRPDQNQ